MGLLVANDILMDIGLALLEPYTSAVLNQAITPGISTVTPSSMDGLYPGANVVVGANGNATEEIITIISITANTFTASFANAHSATEIIRGMTFASGQPDSYLWTQAEVLGYMTDAQQDFLLKVRPVYAVGTVNLTVGKRVYDAPADSIRVERASMVSATSARELFNVSQIDLDLMEYNWMGQSGPDSWYQDQIKTQSIGFGPAPQVGNPVTLFYSQSAPGALGLLSKLIIPDPMTIAIKWRTLSVCLSKDGEQRDPQRAAFAQQFYELVILACQKFLEGVDGRLKSKEETVESLAGERL